MSSTAQTAEKVADLLQNLKVDSQSRMGDLREVPAHPGASSHNSAMEASVHGVADATKMPVAYEAGMDAGFYYPVNGFAMPHGYYYGGFELPMGDWEDYTRLAGTEGVEVANSGVFSENGPLLYHPASYGYGPQHLYGPYTPGTPISAISADGQLYGAQGYPYGGHIYQQLVPPNAPFIPPSPPIGIDAGESSIGASADVAGSENNTPASVRPAYPYGRGILPVSIPISGSQDARVGYEGPRAGTTWADSSKVAESQQRNSLSRPDSIPGQSTLPSLPLLPHIPSGQQQRPPPGAAGSTGTLAGVFQPSLRMYAGPGRAGQGLGMNGLESQGNGRNWIAADKGKLWGRGNGLTSNGNSSLDVFNEQNRGPRTTRTRNQRMAPGAVRYIRGQGTANGTLEPVSTQATKDHHNLPDFATSYDAGKFFVIKSYSEDDIHKSIKYGVWASTANGNKKLDAAYQEAQSGSGHCPLFLFFSVNASGQFCGIAEMVGPVDFNKTLDFWQQDKWTGKFPLKWHVIKDVPNNQFRHIILENNDNKPVTNSRDTQEVKLDQGLEMLKIFKNFALKTSILDDFQFYENRQKAMQEKRARQQQHQQVVYLGSKYMEQKSLQEDASKKLQEGGRPAEARETGGKSVEINDGHLNAVEICNGIAPEEVHLGKSLSKTDSRDLSQTRFVENMSSSWDAVSGSLKSSREEVNSPAQI